MLRQVTCRLLLEGEAGAEHLLGQRHLLLEEEVHLHTMSSFKRHADPQCLPWQGMVFWSLEHH